MQNLKGTKDYLPEEQVYSGGAEILKEVYKLQNQGKRDSGLRIEELQQYINAFNLEDKTCFNPFLARGTEKESLKLAARLRKMGYRVDVEMMGRKLKKSLDYANKENIPYVIILGENELKDRIRKLKDMKNGVETPISLDNIKYFKNQYSKQNY